MFAFTTSAWNARGGSEEAELGRGGTKSTVLLSIAPRSSAAFQLRCEGSNKGASRNDRPGPMEKLEDVDAGVWDW